MWTVLRSMLPCWKKLRAVAEHLREAEGWGWCAGRMEAVGECREDAGTYRSLPEPEAVLTEAEEERLNELMARYDALENQCEESDLLEAEMKLMRCMAKVRAWTPEMRAGSGVVVSWRYGNVCVQRGVQLRSEDDVADDADRTEQMQEKASVEEISLPLLTKMSSERTLAVQGGTHAATGQISGTAGMDALPECVWQRERTVNQHKSAWNVNIIR